MKSWKNFQVTSLGKDNINLEFYLGLKINYQIYDREESYSRFSSPQLNLHDEVLTRILFNFDR